MRLVLLVTVDDWIGMFGVRLLEREGLDLKGEEEDIFCITVLNEEEERDEGDEEEEEEEEEEESGIILLFILYFSRIEDLDELEISF